MRVGFIGLGNIGNPMAVNLRRSGFALVVHDLQRARANNLLTMGASWAGSPRELAAAVDVVITSLPGPAEVAGAVEGPHGVAEGLRAGATLIDMSTNSVDEIRRMGGVLGGRGVSMLDFPGHRRRRGSAPGQGHHVRRWPSVASSRACAPCSRGIGDKIFHMGPLGAGTTTKLITNMIGFTQILALGEGLVLGARGGLDLQTLRAAIMASTAASTMAERDTPMIFDGSYDPSFSLKLACKDIRLAVELARGLAVPVELAPLVERLCETARIRYGDDEGVLTIVKLLEDAAGIALRA